MLDWLKRDPREAPTIELADRTLPLVIRRLAHARRLTLRLAPDGSEARITMPRWGQTAEALAFARTRADWLERQLAALPKVSAPSGGGTLAYRGRALAIEHSAGGSRRVRLADEAIAIGGPAETLAPRLRRWLAGGSAASAGRGPCPLLRLRRPAGAQAGAVQCPAPLGLVLGQRGSADQLAAGHGTGFCPPIGGGA